MAAEGSLVLTDDEALRYTQGMRRALVDDICTDGKMPIDNKDRMVLLAALDGMDRQALTNKRLAGEAANSESARVAAEAMNRLFQQLGNRSPFERKQDSAERVIDMPDQFVEHIDIVPGETEIGLTSLDYDSFMRKTT